MLQPAKYPVAGFVYFFTHPRLWARMFCWALLLAVVAVASLVVALAVLLPLQARALAPHMADALAWIIALVAALVESAALVLVAATLILGEAGDDLFDATLRMQGLGALVDAPSVGPGGGRRGRARRSGATAYWTGFANGVYSNTVLLFWRIVLLIVLAPLHLIPVVGTIIYSYINGRYYAFATFLHYFDLKGLGLQGSWRAFNKKKREFVYFGFASVLLELIPLVNFITPFTNIVGAALWTAEMERAGEGVRFVQAARRRTSPAAAVTAPPEAALEGSRRGGMPRNGTTRGRNSDDSESSTAPSERRLLRGSSVSTSAAASPLPASFPSADTLPPSYDDVLSEAVAPAETR